MKSIDETEAQARLDEIIEEAQRQPIVIRQRGIRRSCCRSPSTSVFAGTQFEHFSSSETRREETTEAGLTDEGIAGMLSED